MITLYGVLLFLHVLGAGLWFGGEAMMFGLRALSLRSAHAPSLSFGTRTASSAWLESRRRRSSAGW